ncbi:BMP family ABC transporter substrate-binding protein [Leucobacter sp. M11]|uniref:BMP family ABC transporter substrate-binding protein n=1 Tax=Leucobacter sp. M11 TaxID=2993565 RepID=UPI002D7E418F|nr:BMP family ABC transporter substrate-binding protein [Leucobacter sp. M11]MEB4613915.1 BMP family ABC transporter substrate-binding protein [Leucobacter sp. M11]
MAPSASRSRSSRLRRTSVALLAGVALLATAGCAARGDAPAASGSGQGDSGEVTQFAIVTPEKESDHGWNQRGLVGAREVANDLGLTLDEYENVGYDNTEKILGQVAEADNQLLIAHASGFNTPGVRVGESSGVPTLVVDYENNVPGSVGTVITRAEEGGYLAGVAAAESTETGVLGIVASADSLNWFQTAGGFAQGAYSVNPDLTIVMTYIGPASYGDSAGGKAAATQVIAAGADVIMGMGDGATLGYLQAIETSTEAHPVRYIATLGDVSEIVTSPDTVLTSVLWDFSDAYRAAIEDVNAGTFGERTYELNVANGGLSLQESAQLSTAALAAVEAASAKIADGTVTVAPSTTKDEVQQRIDGK